MKISTTWLQSYFSKPLPDPEKLADLFTFHAFEVEGVADTVLDLKVLPDRAHYALCHKGIADEVFLLSGIERADKEVTVVSETIIEKPSIKIETKDFCRRYVGRYVEIEHGAGVNEDESKKIASLLAAIGERSITPIVDATNFVMFDIGQPLHAFDADKVKGGIVVRKAKDGEKISLLDSSSGPGKEIELTADDYVIADDEGPLAIAGVKGGKRAAITAETRRLILESANFEPTAVRKTSTKYDLRSESSKRYENEITPELAIDGMNELSDQIRKTIPSTKFGPIVDIYPAKPKQTVINMDPVYISQRLGVEVPIGKARSILEGMGVSISNIQRPITNEQWSLTVPPNRLDLTIADDIVEEVGRIFGYEHVEGVLPPKIEGKIKILPSFYVVEKIKNILIDQGYSEVSLYSLVAKGEVETAKPLAKDKAFARVNLTDGMMGCVEKNVLNADLLGLNIIKVFEVGHVFSTKGESVKICLGVGLVKKAKGITARKVIDEAIESIKSIKSTENNVIEKGNVAVCELDLTELSNSLKIRSGFKYSDLGFGPASKNTYVKFSQYPFIVRDIAVFVPESVKAEEVWSAIEVGLGKSDAKSLLARNSLFDTFKKDGKVSYAFRMVFQSMEKTLTDEEVNSIMSNINRVMKEKDWEVR